MLRETAGKTPKIVRVILLVILAATLVAAILGFCGVFSKTEHTAGANELSQGTGKDPENSSGGENQSGNIHEQVNDANSAAGGTSPETAEGTTAEKEGTAGETEEAAGDKASVTVKDEDDKNSDEDGDVVAVLPYVPEFPQAPGDGGREEPKKTEPEVEDTVRTPESTAETPEASGQKGPEITGPEDGEIVQVLDPTPELP